MADEEITEDVVEEEPTTDEPTEDEPVDDGLKDTEEEPAGEEPAAEEPEYVDDEAEYLREHGIDDVSSVEELIEQHKGRNAQTQTVEPPPQNVQTPEQPAGQEAQGLKPYTEQRFSNHIKEVLSTSPGITEETKNHYTQLGSILDDAMKPMAEQLDRERQMMVGTFQTMAGYLRNDSWGRFPSDLKKDVRRDDLDKIMSSMGYLDYRDAYHDYARGNPALRDRALKSVEKRGEEKGRKLRLKRSSVNRRGPEPKTVSGQPWKGYVGEGGILDNDKLVRLTTKQQLKIIDSYEEHQKKALKSR